MKRVLFVCNNLDHGGIPKALVNLLREIHRDYAVDLLLFYPWGPYLKDIPSDVRILPSEGLLPLLGMPQAIVQKQSKKQAALRAFLVIWSRLFGNQLPRKWIFSTTSELSGYDTAVAFAQDNSSRAFAIGCNAYVLQKVKAKQKVTFVHCDFEQYGGNTRGNRKVYREFDRIACVSRGCREAFLRVMPDLAGRTKIVYNCTDYGLIRKLAEESAEEFEKEHCNLVSVSRITPEKGHLRALKVMKRVMPEEPRLHWFVIGDGPCLEEFQAGIREAGLSERIHLLGMKDNPYCYMRQADALFLPSFHEAAPMVFDEAKTLGLPVLTTETTSSARLIGLTGCGLVCENSEEGIEKGLRKILKEPELLEQFRKKAEAQQLDNQVPREQWERLIRSEE
ncbi:glycosyltransferase [Hominifimenecus sp. rT4P-3]|uniref:glycosyltransferase n=1 Tax=Hominifimenecus sp. rT4P-3 TaxID=3242979 RepID=UPI003DA1E8EE